MSFEMKHFPVNAIKNYYRELGVRNHDKLWEGSDKKRTFLFDSRFFGEGLHSSQFSKSINDLK